jgi:outer membrane protein OmpA-like peptidoglycan-associated protein
MNMRILIIGGVVFVVWSFFSAWLYVGNIKPALNKPVAVQQVPEPGISVAESLMPEDLIIYFEFDNNKFNPDPQTDGRIAEFKTWLDKNPGSMLIITGHTDFVGSAEYNQALGLERALVILKYLESKGLDVNKIMTDSKGKDEPVGYKIDRAKNRRTVITIKK